jgi:NAD(P)-dependent dehydrogenase (short-subunit alcohol dehydrogenase family)
MVRTAVGAPNSWTVCAELCCNGHVQHRLTAGAPGEIAQMALFLASDAASYVNGQGFAVGGGLSPSLPVACIVIEGTADTAEAIDAPAYCV